MQRNAFIMTFMKKPWYKWVFTDHLKEGTNEVSLQFKFHIPGALIVNTNHLLSLSLNTGQLTGGWRSARESEAWYGNRSLSIYM